MVPQPSSLDEKPAGPAAASSQHLTYRAPAPATAARFVSFRAQLERGAAATQQDKVAQLTASAEELHAQGRLQAAIGSLQRAITLAPEQPGLQRRLADLYQEAKLAGRAEQALARARELEGPSPARISVPPGEPAVPAAATPRQSAGAPLTTDQRQAVNQEVQRLLVRLSEIGLQLGNAPGTAQQVTAEVRDRLKNVLTASQQAVRAERAAQAKQAAPVPAAPLPAAPSQPLSARPLPLTHDLGPTGTPDVVSLGPEVATLQQILQGLGITVQVSGRYDGPTIQAVKTLQFRHKLGRRDGVADADIRQLLQKLNAGDA